MDKLSNLETFLKISFGLGFYNQDSPTNKLCQFYIVRITKNNVLSLSTKSNEGEKQQENCFWNLIFYVDILVLQKSFKHSFRPGFANVDSPINKKQAVDTLLCKLYTVYYAPYGPEPST